MRLTMMMIVEVLIKVVEIVGLLMCNLSVTSLRYVRSVSMKNDASCNSTSRIVSIGDERLSEECTLFQSKGIWTLNADIGVYPDYTREPSDLASGRPNVKNVTLLIRDISEEANDNGFHAITERRQLASVSTALLLAAGIGIFEGLALYFVSGVFLNLMGIISSVKLFNRGILGFFYAWSNSTIYFSLNPWGSCCCALFGSSRRMVAELHLDGTNKNMDLITHHLVLTSDIADLWFWVSLIHLLNIGFPIIHLTSIEEASSARRDDIFRSDQ
ncbi:hypothetical protein Tco_1285403 [Tanacetum coccineum]